MIGMLTALIGGLLFWVSPIGGICLVGAGVWIRKFERPDPDVWVMVFFWLAIVGVVAAIL